MGDDVYVELGKFLDKLPGGFPATPDGREIDMLKYLYTPEEAEMTMELRFFPEPASLIAKRAGKPETEVAGMLATMLQKGLCFGVSSRGQNYYQAMQYVVGVHEFHVDSLDREYYEMALPYTHYYKDSMTPVKQFRVVPVHSAIDTKLAVAPYNQIVDLVKEQNKAAVTDCICRKGKSLIDRSCGKPQETCLTFGIGADYYIQYGKGKEISIDRALELVQQADESGLVLMPTNSKNIINICCCCTCCCDLLALLKMHERPAEQVHADFLTRVDPDSCAMCETCLDRCQMEALIERDGSMWVDPVRCIGCGLCVSTCEQGAVSLVSRPSPLPVAENNFHMLAEIAKERGVGFGKLSPMMKRTNGEQLSKMLPLLYKSGLGKQMSNFMAKRGWI